MQSRQALVSSALGLVVHPLVTEVMQAIQHLESQHT